MTRRTHVLAAAAASAVTCLVSARAGATNFLEFPDNGSEQFGRGGAWLARASDPLAAFYNPAGLAGQRTAFTLQANVNFQHSCFDRIKAKGDTTQATSEDASGHFPETCNSGAGFPNPQIAFAYRVSDRLGVGFALVGPSAAGAQTWPDFVSSGGIQTPSPNRYLLVEGNSLFFTPTIAAGYEIADGLRIGASFQWGIMKAKLSQASPAQNANNTAPATNDVKATLIAADYFVPGFTLGALYSPLPQLDVAAWYKWSDTIKASGDIYTQALYYSGNSKSIVDGDTSLANCNVPGGPQTCKSGGNAHVELKIPMEAKVGVRFHTPRGAAPEDPNGASATGGAPPASTAAGGGATNPAGHVRDPIHDDLFDLEADLTWANDSAASDLVVQFPGDQNGNGIIPVNGTGGNLPPTSTVPHGFKDVYGVRVGGDFVVLPDQLSLRAGAFYETNGQDQTLQNLDFINSSKFGLAGGGTYRLHVGAEGTHALEFMLAYGHVFYASETNSDPNAQGLKGLAGTACNPGADNKDGPSCVDAAGNARLKYRTNWPINLGTITSALNVINVGVAYRF